MKLPANSARKFAGKPAPTISESGLTPHLVTARLDGRA